MGYPEIELATKVRAKYIRALEEEDFDSLPGDAYVRGFLRTYADFLGLDGEIYVDEYASRFHTTGYWSDEPEPRPVRPRRTRSDRTFERRAVVLALVAIAMLTALVFAAWQYGGSTTNVPALEKHHAGRLVLRGIGRGSSVIVWRSLQNPAQALFRGTLRAGDVERFTGSRFYVSIERAKGVRIQHTQGVTIGRVRVRVTTG